MKSLNDYCALNRDQMCSVQKFKNCQVPTQSIVFCLFNYCCFYLFIFMFPCASHFSAFSFIVPLTYLITSHFCILYWWCCGGCFFHQIYTAPIFFSIFVLYYVIVFFCFFQRSLALFLNDLIDIICDETKKTHAHIYTRTLI